MSTKYIASGAISTSGNEELHKCNQKGEWGYINGRVFNLNSGLDGEGKPILPEIRGKAIWTKFPPNNACVAWFVDTAPNYDTSTKTGYDGVYFVSDTGEILLHHFTKIVPPVIPHGQCDYTTDHYRRRTHFSVCPYMQNLVYAPDYVIWNEKIVVLPLDFIKPPVGHGHTQEIDGFNFWDGDLIIWGLFSVYNVSKQEMIYQYIPSAPNDTYIRQFMDGWIIFSSNRNADIIQYRIKVTKKVKKPKKPTIPDCPICFEPKPNRMAYGCGHATICEDCDKNLQTCPICMKAIAVRIKLFQ